ncbi:MAG: hypothetical protein MJZ53_06435 [Paludibacteraceae bacterium]|nr:hypothetical protein [Paludibacteraceae bacterium]
MKILIAPLNWGLGHASRCIPLIRQYLADGHEVVLGGDGASLTLLRQHFPNLRYINLAPLDLHYSSSKRQVWAMIGAFPRLIRFIIADHLRLKALLSVESFDLIISDNRFGLYPPKISLLHTPSAQRSILHTPDSFIYITHQLHIHLPYPYRWLESFVSRLHAAFYRRFDEVWVPDYADYATSLAGDLSHPQIGKVQRVLKVPKVTKVERVPRVTKVKPQIIKYLSPLSRFSSLHTPYPIPHTPYSFSEAVYTPSANEVSGPTTNLALLSGLEPQRSLFEQELIERFQQSGESLLIVRGLVNEPATKVTMGNITMVNHLDDEALTKAMKEAKLIIARSGYSTIMDLHVLGVLDKAELHPTPGQPEQEYLAHWLKRYQ